MKLFSGSASTVLAKELAKELHTPLSPLTIKRFADGEIYVRAEESVRGQQVFIVQSLSAPVNDNLMELLIIIDALKRASAAQINAVVPYYGYARQDRKAQPREPISAKLVATFIQAAGAHRLITFDLHANQIQGFFDIPTDNLEAQPILAEHFKGIKDCVVVSPDVGGTRRARNLANLLNAGSIAIIDKRRKKPNQAEALNLIGEVNGKNCIIVDDIIDTAGTISAGVAILKEHGAKDIHLCATHGLLNAPATERLATSQAKSIVITNTIHHDKPIEHLTQLSVAPLLAKCIKSVSDSKPMGVIFDKYYKKFGGKK